MFYKYSKFELKVLLKNRKQLFLGLVLIVFFSIYFQIYLNSEPPTLVNQKEAEWEKQSIVVNSLTPELRETDQEVYDNYVEQLSILGMQIYYLKNNFGRENTQYISDGLRLNELRLAMHEQGNPYISNSLTIPIEEINKENVLLNYLDDHNMIEEDNPFVTSQFMLAAINLLSGIFLFTIVLILCSDMLVYEREHDSVLKALPLSFGTKAISKVSLYFIFTVISLIVGIIFGVLRSATSEGLGNFSYPTIIFSGDEFIAIPIMQYALYAFLAAIVGIFMTVCLTLLLNVFIKNMYGVVLAGLGLFFLPDLLYLVGVKAKFLYPIKFIDISGVLSGDFATKLNDSTIHYWNSVLSMIGFTIIVIGIIAVYNWYIFRQKAKSPRVSEAG